MRGHIHDGIDVGLISSVSLITDRLDGTYEWYPSEVPEYDHEAPPAGYQLTLHEVEKSYFSWYISHV